MIRSRVAVLLLSATALGAQSPSYSLGELVAGLTTTPRVMVIGMHPDDEDSQLLAWLARGQHVQTAYLSITRGEAAGNFLGSATGATLGAARTQEALLSRQIDGAEQYFTRMYDFGYARSDSELFARWNRDSLIGDMVTTIRSFRPHVIVANTPDSADTDIQHRALLDLVREAVAASSDAQRYKPLDFGDAWKVASVRVRAGRGFVIDANVIDAELGLTYADIAERARAEARTQGLIGLAKRPPSLVGLSTVDSSSADTIAVAVDSAFPRLARLAPPAMSDSLRLLMAIVDSLRRDFNPIKADVPRLARIATLASYARTATPACRHPARIVAPTALRAFACDQATLDLDATMDLVLARSRAALLGAALVRVEAVADRELLGASDTATIMVHVFNHGGSQVSVRGIAAWGDVDTTTNAFAVPPGSSVSSARRVAGLSQRYQWWMGQRVANRYTAPINSIDGVMREPRVRVDTLAPSPAAMRANGLFSMMITAGVAIPEDIRRVSDVTVVLDVAGAPVAVSVTPVFRYADATVGLQERPLVGAPDITINLNRALSFVAVGQKIDRSVHVNITSHSSKVKRMGVHIVTPPGLRDSLIPNSFSIGSREQRDIDVQLRGTMTPGEKQAFGVVGSISGQPPFSTGFRTTQYPHLLPIRVSWQSGMWMQPVEITVPKTLVVAYVGGVSDDVPMALQDVGVSVANIPPADLLAVDLKRVTTLVFGPRAFEAHPELLLQMPRLMSWARNGGTIVVQRGGPATLKSGALPHFVDLGATLTQRISDFDAPVTRLATAPTLLQWPNIIGPDDWKNWISERAPYAPTRVDPQYQRVIETHNLGDAPNENTLLVAPVGKGRFIYCALTLDEQIAAGVPGPLRLMVNLLSAGLTPPGAR